MLKGEEFLSTERHGKNLFIETSGPYWLRLHFGMTGFLDYFKDRTDKPRQTRVLFRFTNGYNLAYICQRLLGQVALEENINDFLTANKLGIDALEITFPRFRKIAEDTKSAVKSLLMDPQKIAGLGDIYADEVLCQSRFHLKINCSGLDEPQLKNLPQHRQSPRIRN